MLDGTIDLIWTSLINNSFLTGVFPPSYKISKILLILKKGDPNNSDNYRPKNIITYCGKIMGKKCCLEKEDFKPRSVRFLDRFFYNTGLTKIIEDVVEGL